MESAGAGFILEILLDSLDVFLVVELDTAPPLLPLPLQGELHQVVRILAEHHSLFRQVLHVVRQVAVDGEQVKVLQELDVLDVLRAQILQNQLRVPQQLFTLSSVKRSEVCADRLLWQNNQAKSNEQMQLMIEIQTQ